MESDQRQRERVGPKTKRSKVEKEAIATVVPTAVPLKAIKPVVPVVFTGPQHGATVSRSVALTSSITTSPDDALLLQQSHSYLTAVESQISGGGVTSFSSAVSSVPHAEHLRRALKPTFEHLWGRMAKYCARVKCKGCKYHRKPQDNCFAVHDYLSKPVGEHMASSFYHGGDCLAGREEEDYEEEEEEDLDDDGEECEDGAYVYGDQCAHCGRLFSEHDATIDGHFPVSQVAFDLLIRMNVCPRHGRSEPLMHQLRAPVVALYKDTLPKIIDWCTKQFVQTGDGLDRILQLGETRTKNPLYFNTYELLTGHTGELQKTALHPRPWTTKFGKRLAFSMATLFATYQKDFLAYQASSSPSSSSSYGPDLKGKGRGRGRSGSGGRRRGGMQAAILQSMQAPRSCLDAIGMVFLRFSCVILSGTSCQQLLKSYYRTLCTTYPYLTRAVVKGKVLPNKRLTVDPVTGRDGGIIAQTYHCFAELVQTLTQKVKSLGSKPAKPDVRAACQFVNGTIRKGSHLRHVANSLLAEMTARTEAAIVTCRLPGAESKVLHLPEDFDVRNNPKPGTFTDDDLLLPVVCSETGLLEGVMVNPNPPQADYPPNYWPKVKQVARGLTANIERMYTLSLLGHFAELNQAMDELEQLEAPDMVGVIAAASIAYVTCSRRRDGDRVTRVLKELVPRRAQALSKNNEHSPITARHVMEIDATIPSPEIVATVAENCAFSLSLTLPSSPSSCVTSSSSPFGTSSSSLRMYSPAAHKGVRTVVRDLTTSLDALSGTVPRAVVPRDTVPRAMVPHKAPRQATEVVATIVPARDK